MMILLVCTRCTSHHCHVIMAVMRSNMARAFLYIYVGLFSWKFPLFSPPIFSASTHPPSIFPVACQARNSTWGFIPTAAVSSSFTTMLSWCPQTAFNHNCQVVEREILKNLPSAPTITDVIIPWTRIVAPVHIPIRYLLLLGRIHTQIFISHPQKCTFSVKLSLLVIESAFEASSLHVFGELLWNLNMLLMYTDTWDGGGLC